ncbi:unnamed protein product [Tuber melanosporum]|uniref:(Perigord truffle) hypothetical protein n=1 Tax=Tuber melanosporum (strain Mel28) TaxID=656061 RepID=D5G4Y2_TUBMM|nr:uncharacterized protein GSTUM_00000152001 [Tuber melanosporum]CAZ79575.1 unnamed protein product [Tuber melanosporum]
MASYRPVHRSPRQSSYSKPPFQKPKKSKQNFSFSFSILVSFFLFSLTLPSGSQSSHSGVLA